MPQPDPTHWQDQIDRHDAQARAMTWKPVRRDGAVTHNEPRRSWQDSVITLTVAVVAAAASYGHMFEVALMAGEPQWIARAFPITVDGLVLAALRRGPQGRWWLRLGVLISVAANVVSRYPDLAHAAGPVVSAWPPLALYGTHRLLHGSRRKPQAVDEGADVVESSEDSGSTAAREVHETQVPRVCRAASAAGRSRAGIAEVTEVVIELESQGLPVNRTVVAKRVRAAGLSLSNERADRLLAQILEDPKRLAA